MVNNSDSKIIKRCYNKEEGGGSPSSSLIFEIQSIGSLINGIDKFLDTFHAAKILNISPNALRLHAHRGSIKCYRFGSRLRFRLCDSLKEIKQKEY